MRRFLASITLLSTLVAQQPQEGSAVFKTDSNLIIVNITVRDKSGKPLENLKKEDFLIFEDDKPQQISVFELEKLGADPLPPISVPEPPKQKKGQPPPPVQVAQKPKEDDKEEVSRKDKRLMVLFFDLSSMPPADQIRAQESSIKFLEKQMTASDLVSIMTFGTSLKLVEDFTGDREVLVHDIQSFRTGEGSDITGDAATPVDEDDDSNVLFTADDSEFNIFNTDRKLGAIEAAARQLSAYPEKKALIYFSSGVGKTGAENHSQLQATINAAIKSNISIYAVDARGLVASAPAGDATKASPTGRNLFSGQSQRNQRDNFNDQQETLYSLAADTGGKALLDSNDLTVGMTQAQRDFNSYYLVGYYSSNSTPDGRYRRIRVKLANNLTAKLDYRQGYYASKVWKSFNSTDKERQLEEAMQLGNPVTDLPVALEVNYFRLDKDKFFIPVAVKIPGSEITVSKKGSSEQTELDFLGQIRDSKNKVISTVRDTIKVKLSEENATLLAKRQLQYDTGFQLSPGDYKLRFIARENLSGKLGTFETKFNVPDLSSRSDSVRTSSVVWSNQLEPVNAQIGAASKNNKLLAKHPLVHDGQKLAPSITRVYRRNQKLYVYFEVYDPSREEERPSVAANLTIYKGKKKAFESSPIRLNQFAENRGATVAFQFQAALAQLKPGDYTAQVSVIDELGRKFAFSRAPLILRE